MLKCFAQSLGVPDGRQVLLDDRCLRVVQHRAVGVPRLKLLLGGVLELFEGLAVLLNRVVLLL